MPQCARKPREQPCNGSDRVSESPGAFLLPPRLLISYCECISSSHATLTTRVSNPRSAWCRDAITLRNNSCNVSGCYIPAARFQDSVAAHICLSNTRLPTGPLPHAWHRMLYYVRCTLDLLNNSELVAHSAIYVTVLWHAPSRTSTK